MRLTIYDWRFTIYDWRFTVLDWRNDMAKFITREVVQEAQDIPWEDVPVDEWEKGAVVRMVGLNAKDAATYSKGMVKLDKKGNVEEVKLDDFLPRLVVKCAVDENFMRLFGEEDIEWLNKKSAKVMKRLADAAQRLSGMNDDGVEQLKNSNETPSADSPSA